MSFEEDPFQEGGQQEFGDDPFGDAGAGNADLGGYGADDLGGYGAVEDDAFGNIGAADDNGAAFGGDDAFDGLHVAAPVPQVQLGDLGVDSQSEKYAIWRREQAETLAKKENDGRLAKEEIKETARADMQRYMSDRQERLSKIRDKNRQEERNRVEAMNTVMQHGSPWEKVGQLVNLGNVEKGSMVDRMRSLLIQLKNETPS